MKISFCGFDENTKVEDIRKRIGEPDFEINKERSNLPKSEFDLIVCTIIGTFASDDEILKKYIEMTHPKNPTGRTPLERNLHNSIGIKEGGKIEQINTFLNGAENCETLKDIYDYLKDSENWASEDQKEKVLKLLVSGTSTGQTVEEDNIKKEDIDDVEEFIKDKIKSYKQVIFTGAPGTGKTYSVRKFLNDHIQEGYYKFIQFHPSYDYSDFVEGLRPANIHNSTEPAFVRMDGIFKKFCRKIVEDALNYIMDQCDDINYSRCDLSIEEKRNELLEKIYSIKKSEKQKIIKYKDDSNVLDETKKIKEALDVFEKENKYYFIVDEINRADLPKVFGELMFGLEESYRGIENRFDTQYKNLKTYKIEEQAEAHPMSFDCFEKGFFIPHNLIFIGTMNDIDRSVESFDFALRRRFQWVEIKANNVMKKSLKKMWAKTVEQKSDVNSDDWIEKIKNMNEELTSQKKYGLTYAYHIGPAYFKEFDGTNMKTIFIQKIEPIIKEYLRGRNVEDIKGIVDRCREILLG